MSWERRLFALFDDLEGQADGLLGRERDWEVVEQARAEYASVALVTRLMASTGREVDLRVHGVGRISGRLLRCTETWSLLERAEQEWVVPHRAVATAVGLSERSLHPEAWPVTARLGLASALRRLAEDEDAATVLLLDGTRLEGTWGRVGQDFAELMPVGVEASSHQRAPLLVAHRAIAALTRRPATVWT
ncbi:hypothetical protein [Nocardioides alcanivorans]|uniref:hypothetical protein n=1 Tax=Nocardioides alcanivorans TaxID=2897352 RepID=UPI001F38732B|nr:hypothetical protein [Nocardioides alcanivorans]